jgi:predicted Zn-dependent protease
MWSHISSQETINVVWYKKFIELLDDKQQSLQICNELSLKFKKMPESDQCSARFACGLLEAGEIELAEKFFNVNFTLVHWWPKTRYAVLLFQQGESKKLEEFIKKLYRECADAKNAYSSIAMELEKLNKSKEAESYYQRDIQQGRISAGMLVNAAILFFKQSSHDLAFQYIEKAYKENPSLVNAYARCAAYSLKFKRYDEALQLLLLDVKLKKVSQNYLAYYFRTRFNNVDGAFKNQISKVYKQDITLVNLAADLAAIHIQKGDFLKANSLFIIDDELKKMSADKYLVYIDLQCQLTDYTKALELLHNYFEHYPEVYNGPLQASTFLPIIKTLSEKHLLDDATNYTENLYKVHPILKDHYATIAQRLLQDGKYEMAREYFQKDYHAERISHLMLLRFACCQAYLNIKQELITPLIDKAYEENSSLQNGFADCAEVWALKGDLTRAHGYYHEDYIRQRSNWKAELKYRSNEQCLQAQTHLAHWKTLQNIHQNKPALILGENCTFKERPSNDQILIGTDRAYIQAFNAGLDLDYWLTFKKSLLAYSMTEYTHFLPPKTIKILPIQALALLQKHSLENIIPVNVNYLQNISFNEHAAPYCDLIDISLLQFAIYMGCPKITIYTKQLKRLNNYINQLPSQLQQNLDIHLKENDNNS